MAKRKGERRPTKAPKPVRPDDTWKVRLIEEDLHRLMFDVEDV